MKDFNYSISVIIPVFNEEDSLPQVISDLPTHLIEEIIVVNNASTDQSSNVAKTLGCKVVAEQKRGYGKACLKGIEHLNPNTDIVVFIDGDYSDHPEQLSRILKPLIEKGYDFVLGSRMLGQREKGAMTFQSFWGNRLACLLMKWFWGIKYTDLGPFRAIRYDSLKELKMTDEDFGWTIEMQIKAAASNLKTTEVPVDYRRRIGKSKISGTVKGSVLAGYKILYTIFKYHLVKRVRKPAVKFS